MKVKVKEVAVKLYGRLMDNEAIWVLDRAEKFSWIRTKIARPIECLCCGGTISANRFADLLCAEFAFRKICLEVFCEFCSKSMKRDNALVKTLYELHLNGK
ncbi:MAG: hypothetical protein RMK89_13905 [Armatimonadota bacterium]|nr:hypothetical protein [Armatimonadota bacterium]MDW8144540.1 hypothetical protein [Armatimonadota bacterium]